MAALGGTALPFAVARGPLRAQPPPRVLESQPPQVAIPPPPPTPLPSTLQVRPPCPLDRWRRVRPYLPLRSAARLRAGLRAQACRCRGVMGLPCVGLLKRRWSLEPTWRWRAVLELGCGLVRWIGCQGDVCVLSTRPPSRQQTHTHREQCAQCPGRDLAQMSRGRRSLVCSRFRLWPAKRALVLIMPVEFHCRYVVRICSQVLLVI